MEPEAERRAARLRQLALVLGALGIGLQVWRFFRAHSYSIYDDTYIYFTYADHLVDGCGLRFRCDQPPIEGFTSPLYLVLLVLARWLTPDLETVSQLLGLACLSAALLGLWTAAMARTWQAMTGLDGRATVACAVVAVALLVLDDFVLVTGVTGLETSLAMGASVLLLAALVSENVYLVQAAACFGVLCRPEYMAFLFALPFLTGGRAWRSLWPTALFLVAMTAFRWLEFRDVLPNTYWAKRGGDATHWRMGLAYLRDALEAHPAILGVPLLACQPRLRRLALYVTAALAVWAASVASAGGDVFYYDRLLMPVIPVGTLLGVVGVACLARRLVGAEGAAPRRRARGGIVLVSATVLCLLAGRETLAHGLPPAHGFANVARWSDVGEFIAQHHAGALVAVVPIGIISWKCRCRVLDLVGLTNREIGRSGGTVPRERMNRNWIGHERHNVDWVLEQAPDLIVFTKYRDMPWQSPEEAVAGFYSEWLLLQKIKAGQAPYQVYSAEVSQGIYWLMFRRK